MGDWCNKHELPLSHCRQCNPKLTFSASEPLDWCNEHAVPESMCTKCHSELVAKFIAAGDYCREHGFPKSICPRCNPQLLLERGVQLPPFPEPGLKVRLASADTARDAGLETVVVQPQPFSPTIEVVGQIQFDQNRLAQLSPRADAVVRAIHADIGDSISDGQALIELASAAVGEDQARLAAARARIEAAKATLAREESLSKSGISPRKSVEAARTELAAAQAEHESARSALGAAGAGPETERGRYVLTAPFAGTVVARDAVIGRTATSGQVLMEIADLSTMWVILEVPELEASRVQVGQKVTLRFNSLSDEVRQSTVGRVASSIDPETRTMHARVDLPNLDRKLKAGTLVRAGIHVADERQVLVVPEGAVQQVEGHSLVFVKESAAVYAPVAVTAGAKANQSIEIVDGLAPGSEIVTVGAFLLKTEVLKDSIGAGCCEGGAE
ncbi:MAG TPA: efflux RND transporter periplasmic adaptor subunit [Terriglobales bacterium]|nr:efflux RND transporter periplasmic adaptor subunit [Terriglobales bacterium]